MASKKCIAVLMATIFLFSCLLDLSDATRIRVSHLPSNKIQEMNRETSKANGPALYENIRRFLKGGFGGGGGRGFSGSRGGRGFSGIRGPRGYSGGLGNRGTGYHYTPFIYGGGVSHHAVNKKNGSTRIGGKSLFVTLLISFAFYGLAGLAL